MFIHAMNIITTRQVYWHFGR